LPGHNSRWRASIDYDASTLKVREMRILAVDDDTGTLNALRAYLATAGYEVVAAPGGCQALEMIEASIRETEPIDLMITDLKMPRMNGLELIQKARTERLWLPALLMTAYGDASVRRKVKQLRSCGYLEKPFDPEELLAKIDDALRWR